QQRVRLRQLRGAPAGAREPGHARQGRGPDARPVVVPAHDRVSPSPRGATPLSSLRRLLREPLLHFLVLGAAIFPAYAFVTGGRGGAEPSRQIQLTLDDLGQLALGFESQWRRPPTPEEFGHLVETKVQEEVLYREALAMGLDKDDTIVRRRMA